MIILTVTVPGLLREETTDAIREFWPKPHQWDVYTIAPDDPRGYERILAAYWKSGEDFAVVEPDVVIRPDVVEAMLGCECTYGAYPYPWVTDVGAALGCTWFRTGFLERCPHAMKEVAAENVSWKQLDVVLMRRILARKYKEQPHVHLPAVVHLNEEKKLLPEANPEPLMEVPLW